MGYKIQISGSLLESDEVSEQLEESDRNHTVIPDLVAKTIASWWHSPGPIGRVLSQLSHGIVFDTDELIADIDKTMPEVKSPSDRQELIELRLWAEHWTGNYLNIHKAEPGPNEFHCGICGQGVMRVPGGQGRSWIHTDSGAVAAPNPPGDHRG